MSVLMHLNSVHKTPHYSYVNIAYRNKMASDLQTTFRLGFPCLKYLYFDYHFIKGEDSEAILYR